MLAEKPGTDLSAGLTSDLLARPDEIGRPLSAGREVQTAEAEVVTLLQQAGRLVEENKHADTESLFLGLVPAFEMDVVTGDVA